jgi:hypothetical protein
VIAWFCPHIVESGIDDFKTTPSWWRVVAQQSSRDAIPTRSHDEYERDKDSSNVQRSGHCKGILHP